VLGASTPPHLGGHLSKTHVDRGALEWIRDTYKVSSMIDIGCGPGGMREVAESIGITWYGVDGDPAVATPKSGIALHDFTIGPYSRSEKFDLAWSVEFLEHVSEGYLPNYMELFSKCRIVAATAAPPGYPGHHHVNCRGLEYWQGAFAANGFRFNATATAALRDASTMQKPFMQSTGMIFEKYA